jgi:hypothetical protein
MSKKQDFLRSEQSRDKHPEREQVGGATRETLAAKGDLPHPDKQQPHTGKLANDHNKMGEQEPTQVNEGRRTPESRHDQQQFAGGPQNQVSTRKTGSGGGRTPDGAG